MASICVLMSTREAFIHWAEKRNFRIYRKRGCAENIDNGNIYYHCLNRDHIHGMKFSSILIPEGKIPDNDLYAFALPQIRNK